MESRWKTIGKEKPTWPARKTTTYFKLWLAVILHDLQQLLLAHSRNKRLNRKRLQQAKNWNSTICSFFPSNPWLHCPVISKLLHRIADDSTAKKEEVYKASLWLALTKSTSEESSLNLPYVPTTVQESHRFTSRVDLFLKKQRDSLMICGGLSAVVITCDQQTIPGLVTEFLEVVNNSTKYVQVQSFF